ncbi:uncharacterized protein LOC144055426 isoform X1 [Vanacampus margaritifer]
MCGVNWNAAEELADQVQAPPPAADRRPQATSGDPDEEEEDEENQSSQGHVSERAAECRTLPEARKASTTRWTWYEMSTPPRDFFRVVPQQTFTRVVDLVVADVRKSPNVDILAS